MGMSRLVRSLETYQGHRILFAAVALSCMACNGVTELPAHLVPESFNAVRPSGLEASGTAVFRRDGSGRAGIQTEVTFSNPTSTTAQMELLSGPCVIRILIHSGEDFSRSIIWNGLDTNCPEPVRELTVPPGQSTVLSNWTSVPASVENAASRGGARAHAVLQVIGRARLLGVDAGLVQVVVPEK